MPETIAAAVAAAGKYAAEAELHRRLSPEVVDALKAAGFARHFVPARWGGLDGTVTDMFDAVAAVGEECTSAAWCASVYAGGARMGAYLPERGQAELWAAGPDTLIAGALIPGGAVTRTDNGWTVTGAWGFTSGVEDADWALVGGPMTGEATRFFAVPRGDFSVSDTWSTVGMRGTGSNTLVLDGVYVPEHRSFLREEMLQGRPVGSSAACHSIPLRAVNGLSFAAPVLGAARGALGGRAGAEVFARSAGEIDAAELLLRRAASVADSGAVDPRLVARGIRDCALAADFLVIAVERLFRAAGSRAHAETDRIQRAWRDVHTASSHVVLQFEPAAAAYAGQFLTSK